MRILVDLQGAQTASRLRGIGRYSLALTKEIARQAGSHDVWLVLSGNFPDSIDVIKSHFNGLVPQNQILVFRTPCPVSYNIPGNLWRARTAELLREAFLANLHPDIVYVTSLFEGWLDDATTSVGLFEKAGKTAVTLYDLIPLLNQDAYLPDQAAHNFYFNKIDSLKKTDLLLSISEFTRQEGITALHLEPERIVNISTAVDDIFCPIQMSPEEVQGLHKKYSIAQPFIMYTGGTDPRKNVSGLFDGFSRLPNHLRAQYQLLLAGELSKNAQESLKLEAKKYGVDDRLILANYVSDSDLVGLYNSCTLFVFPSLHEGFGLPALEAMACGAPTIGSNTTGIPEVIGHEDALFDPTRPEDLSEKIAEVLTNDSLRNSLREHGLQQAQKFSWQVSAGRALDAFESIVPAPASDRSIFLPINTSLYKKLINMIAAVSQGHVQPTTRDLITTAQSVWNNEKTADRALRSCHLGEKIRWRIEGTFHDTYSLSLLNRETAKTLAQLGHEVALWSSDEPGFYLPDEKILSEYLSENPDLAQMYERARVRDHKEVDVVSRNIYPPYVSDMQGRLNLLHHYAWEESGFPAEWVNNFNEHLQGVTCLSTHVEKVLIDHGVNVPLSTSGCGVDHWERIQPDADFQVQARSFRFLHVSSCFPRKGADILLDAYGQVFRDSDDVSLIIKTFPNRHNLIHEWLAKRRKNNPEFPHVIIIETNLTDGQLKSLYQQCHAMVGPSRGEGFCLPFAEAMLSGLPVITTNWGGQLDFCNENTAWLVDYEFVQAQTHFNLFNSLWAKPDVKDLAEKMREVYMTSPAQRTGRAEAGRRLLLDRFKWTDVVERMVRSARDWASIPEEPDPKIGWITTWNTKCGIASYSAHLVREMPGVNILAANTDLITGYDDENVARCWTKDEYADRKDNLNELTRKIEEQGLDTLVVQFNYGFFDFQNLNSFLIKHLDAGRIVIVVFHSTTDPESQPQRKLERLLPALQRCQRLLVHSINDLNRLKSMGLINNVTLFPHGVMDYIPTTKVKHKTKKLIASYGFFLPHKGLLELIDAFALMRESGETVELRMVNAEYPVPLSAGLIRQAHTKIRELNIAKHVELITEYLPDQKSLDLISEADLIVFPYQQTGESSSAAVRYGLATGCPVAVTPLQIFDDVSPAVLKLPGFSPALIAQGITKMLSELEKNSLNIQNVRESANQWRKVHYYSQLAGRLYSLMQALHRKQAPLPRGAVADGG